MQDAATRLRSVSAFEAQFFLNQLLDMVARGQLSRHHVVVLEANQALMGLLLNTDMDKARRCCEAAADTWSAWHV